MTAIGYIDLDTAPVTAAPARFPGMGRFAPLAGPTIAADGTVLLGTVEGKVWGLHPDGRPFWNRQLPHPQGIMTPGAVGADGSAYFVGQWRARDHRDGTTHMTYFAALHRFTPGGGVLAAGGVAFPDWGRGPRLVGAPSVWQFGGVEAIIIPAVYAGVGPDRLRLLAFSPSGQIIGDWSQTLTSEVTGGGWGDWWALLDWLGSSFEPGRFLPPTAPPMPGVAISVNPQGGTPFVVLVDSFFRQTIAFTLATGTGSSPPPGFIERVRRSHAPHTLLSGAVVAPETNQAVVGVDDGVVFGGPSGVNRRPLTGLGDVYTTPTITADGRVVVVSVGGEVIGLRAGSRLSRVFLGGSTIARVAATRNYTYACTTSGLFTLDAAAETRVASYPLTGAGVWSPAVGPQRHIYVIADHVLHVFPPLRRLPRRPRGGGTGSVGDVGPPL